MADLRFSEHPTIANQHHTFQMKSLSQNLDLVWHRGGIGCVSLVHLHGERTPLLVGEDTVNNDRTIYLSVPIVAEFR